MIPESLKKVIFICGKENTPKFFILISLMLIIAFLEAVSLGAVIPLFASIVNPELIKNNHLIQKVFAYFQWSLDTTTLITVLCIFLSTLFLIKSFVTYISTRIQGSLIHELRIHISTKLYGHYLSLSYQEHLNKNISELIHNSTGQAGSFVLTYLVSLLGIFAEAFIVCFVFSMIFFVNPLMTLLTVVLMSLIFALYALWGRKKLNIIGEVQHESTIKLYQCITESLGALKETKVYGKESFFYRHYEQLSNIYKKPSIFLHVLSLLPKIVIECFFILFVSASIVFAVQANIDLNIIAITLTTGGLAFFRLLPSLNKMLSYYTNLKIGSVSLDVVYNELLHANTQVKLNLLPHNFEKVKVKEHIILKNVNFSYGNNDVLALNNVSLTIKKGESVAFIGKSGAGKTTIVDTLLGLLPNYSGDILVDNINIKDNLSNWQQSIGYIPQTINLFEGSIRHNIAFGVDEKEIDEDKLLNSVKLAQLEGFINSLPEGLQYNIGDRGKRLSGGQKQRLGIARALYNDPDILILDEATSALDIETEQEFSKAICEIGKTKTIIIIAHRLNTIRHCDTIYLMNNGEIENCGTYDELKQKSSWFNQITLDT